MATANIRPSLPSARDMFTSSIGGFEMSSAITEIEEVQRFFSDIEARAEEMAGLIAELRRKVEAQNPAIEEFEREAGARALISVGGGRKRDAF
ncbi:MAG TPA: hypothetical protein VGR78_16375 [Verrucomicrobiae bacterium]|nr:hypothetical protein [Verrucomicrobiae bacterium]